jgi:L-ascorbate metabolism protein UlaG (beta-lactamase superfamily)
MGPAEGAAFAKESGASIVCPIHGESERFPTDWNKVKHELEKAGVHYKILELKEVVEL